jgi:alpha-glucosidase (family GH31 glycosyl hydrolase)
LRLQARSRFAKGKGAFQMDHPMIGWESSFDSYDDALDTYDFSGSFDDDACVEPHVEKSLARSKMKHSEVANRCLSMRVALCALPDVRRATETCLATLPRPAAPPPPEVIRAPIWTTWARYKQNVDQKKTLTFAREILHHDLPASVMEIDDKWQAGYGELDFDMNKFPDPKEMVDELHALGFAVTLWVMPFVEEDTDAYREGSEKGYFVTSKRRHGNLKPGFFKWWNTPPVVALDVTNPDAVNWFVTRLKSLQQRYGIDGFKFDAGEPCFLPRMFETREALGHPSEYTRYWVERVASQFALAEVRTGHGTTGVGVLTRMGDRFSEWGSGNGLRSIIPTLLTSGVMGYPFCLPDMIGGNAYFGRRPDRELLVRWAQANALMPAMQFSIAPWDAGADVAELIKQSLKVRERIVDVMIRLTGEACLDLAPMCRPMWWLDPTDEKTYRIADQFAVGDDVIVAPVVTRGAVTRDVYLTKGSWVDISAEDDDGAERKTYRGGAWLFGYDAPLHKLPCFVRVDDDARDAS